MDLDLGLELVSKLESIEKQKHWFFWASLYFLHDVVYYYYYLRIETAEGYVLIAVYLFICMRVIRITQKVLNRIA